LTVTRGTAIVEVAVLDTPRGAHLLLQIRTRVLNDTLTNDYRRWYPGFTHSTSEADTLGDQLLAA
jgi:hypothetical protein